ncbi:MAG: hypothetical protein Q9177_003132 [Variospora cf. flavescens]
MTEQANEAHQIEKGKNHAKTPEKASLVQSGSEDGRIPVAANHKLSDVNLIGYFREFDRDSNDGLSGQDIARLFADQVGQTLDAAEFKMLLDFLNKPPTILPLEHLHNTVSALLQEFHNAEIQESGEPLDRLATPSGPESAPLGLVLHVQTKKGKAGEFWDSENSSIQTLEKKGLSSASIYAFDWHWRAEESARNRGSCSTRQWSEKLLSLHNSMSFHLLEFLPLPFLIVAGSCAKAGYRRTLSKRSKRIGLAVKPYSIIEFDLDFRNDGLRRISAYMDHPAACFYRPKYAIQNAICQDAVVNFFLWLIHSKSSRTTFSDLQRSHPNGALRKAPLKEMWQYLKMEKDQNRNLKQQEYELGFLTWARRFLEEDLVGILEQGGSIAEAVSKKINKRLSAAIANRTSTPERKSRFARQNREILKAYYKIQYRESWHGAIVKIDKSGTLRIFVSTDQRALAISLGKRVFQKIKAYGEPTTIEFAKIGIALKVGEHIVQARSRQMLSRLKGGTAWVKQLDREVEHLETQTFASSEDTSQSMTPENGDSAITQQETGVSEAVIGGDLRHRLLSNALFHCSKWPHGSKAGRVYFRGVAIYVPKQAEVCKGVRVLRDLSAENVSHSTPCAIDATEEDPARRLGIRVTFFNKESVKRGFNHTFALN